MKKFFTLLIGLLVASAYVGWRQQKQITTLKATVDSLTKQNDSLYSESSAKEFQLQRYDLIMQRAEEELPGDCVDQLKEIKGQTE